MKELKKKYTPYTESERMSYIREYLSTSETKYQFAKRTGICRRLLILWLDKYHINDKVMSTDHPSFNKYSAESLNELEKELAALRAENLNLSHQGSKKLRCQVIDTLSQGNSARHMRGRLQFLCDYFGITRQGYYKHVNRKKEIDILTSSIVLYCNELRKLMPKAGIRELYACCLRKFGVRMVIGRDQCYNIFRANGLCQRVRHVRPKTTNSNHNYYIYPDLLNVTPKFVADTFGSMVVADITYVATYQGWAYLSLLTDAGSRAIVGYALCKTLEAEGPLKALRMAIDFYNRYNVDLSSLIHHSDRGVQYCSNLYVDMLKKHHINISMTQCGDPLHNALAERMNNTIKNGWLFDCEDDSFEQLDKRISDAIYAYNYVRPHQGIQMKTPMEHIRKYAEKGS